MAESASGFRQAVVTGAGGFLGRQLCRQLLSAGYGVTAVLRPGGRSAPPGTDARALSLFDREGLAAACAGVDVVFHLAGIAHTQIRDRALLRQVNIEGTAAVIEACQAVEVPRLVYFSSILAESDDSAYAASKRTAERMLLSRCDNREQAPEPVILRPVNVYGEGMQGGLAALIRAIDRGRLPPLPRLKNRLALVSAEDVCQAALRVAETPGIAGRSYAVTDGQHYTPNDIEAAVYAALGRKRPGRHSPRVLFLAAAALADLAARLQLYHGGLRLRSYRNLVSDNPVSSAQLTADTGYRPSGTLAGQLEQIIASLRE